MWVLCCLHGFGVGYDSFSTYLYIYILYIYIYLDTYVRWSRLFIPVCYIRFFKSYSEFCLRLMIVFSWDNFPLKSYWGLSCDYGLHCSDDVTWQQQPQQQQQQYYIDSRAYLLGMSVEHDLLESRCFHTKECMSGPHSVSRFNLYIVYTSFPFGMCVMWNPEGDGSW